MQNFIHPTMVSLELGGSQCLVSLPMFPSAQPQWRKPTPNEGALLKDTRDYAFAQAMTCARLCLPFFLCSVFQPFLPIHAEVQFCPQYCVTHLYKVCKVLSAAPLALAASCSVKKEERLGKALDHLRAGAKQFQAQNLLYPC